MLVEDKLVNLTPGIAVTVENKDRIAQHFGYLLSPLKKYGSESLKER
jgi:hemolysin D